MDIIHSRRSFGQAVRRAIRAKALVSYERDHWMGRTAVLADGTVLDYTSPHNNPRDLAPEQPSHVTLCGLCDGARERYAAAVAFGRIVTVAPCDQHRFLGEGRF